LTNFVANRPWTFHGNEKSLDAYVGLNIDSIKKFGLNVNESYSSVDRVG